MRILVTGAAGFIGARVAALAQAAGHDVIGWDRRTIPDAVPMSSAQVDLGAVEVGVLDQLPPLRWADGMGAPEVVIHAAGRPLAAVRHEVVETDNVYATRAVVAACERWGHGSHGQRPRLLHVSSAAVLRRRHDQLDLEESAPVPEHRDDDVARTHAEAEQVVATYAGPWVIARPATVIGERDPVTLPRLLTAARAGWMSRVIRRPSPALSDLVYVDNVADHLLALAEHGELAGVYHLTNAEPVELQPQLLGVLEQLGVDLPARAISARTALRLAAGFERTWRVLPVDGPPPLLTSDAAALAFSTTFSPERMLRDLGSPKISLAEGLDRYVSWERAQQADRLRRTGTT